MLGLIRKDIYLLKGRISAIQLVPLLAPIIVAVQNRELLMPLLTIVISLAMAALVSDTISMDEEINWLRVTYAMPLKPSVHACSKYLLLLLFSVLSSLLLFILGKVCSLVMVMNIGNAYYYAVLSFVVMMIYGIISIPSSFKFGTARSKYIFMLFILVPTAVPLVLSAVHVKVDISFIYSLHIDLYILLPLIFLFLFAGMVISLVICCRIIRNKRG